MARARNIKPSFFKNEDLGSADPLVGLLFISLWTLADKEGRLEDRPLRIRAETFPYRENIDINGYLTQLVSFGLIERYKSDGLSVIQIVTFEKHQSPHSTEKKSDFPKKPDELPAKPIESTITVNPPLNNASACVNPDINVLNPESLFIDSLIPECGIMNVESAAIAAPPPPQKTITKKTRSPDPLAVNWNQILKDHGVSDDTASGYLAVRKLKNAGSMTKLSLDALISEGCKAGLTLEQTLQACCTAGGSGGSPWVGFKAAWYENAQSGGQQGTKPQANPRGFEAHQAAALRDFERYGGMTATAIPSLEAV
jgi:hypothetical protein